MIKFNKVFKRYPGEMDVLQDINLEIDAGDLIFVTGSSGAGKSTLLKILCGDGTEDSGRIVYRKGIRVDYLEQADDLNPKMSVFEEVLSADTKEVRAIKEYDKALRNPDDQKLYTRAFDMMNATNAWDYEVKISTILSQLKIEDKQQKIKELSGGQKKRVALAKVLINEPDIMILDEPTNHLDVDSREALIHAINDYDGAVLLISHDRHLVEACVDRLWIVEEGDVKKFDGDLEEYRKKLLAERVGEKRDKSGKVASQKDNRKQAAENRTQPA